MSRRINFRLMCFLASGRGAFPVEVVFRIVDGTRTLRAHGSFEMPVWGRSFTHKQISAITQYLRTIQTK